LWRRLTVKVLKPGVVDVNSSLVEELLKEENVLEGRRHKRMLSEAAGFRR